MVYSARIRLAVGTAFLLHLAGLFIMPFLMRDARPAHIVEAVQKPIVLSFNRLEPDEPKRLVESGAPAEQPVAETDLISDRDAQAQDLSGSGEEADQPAFDEVSDFDQLGLPPSPPVPEEPESVEEIIAPPVSAEETIVVTTLPEEAVPEPATESSDPGEVLAPVAQVPVEPEQPGVTVERLPAELERRPEEALEAPERFELAQAPAQPVVQPQEIRATHGRESSGADRSGFTSFEANRHEMGEYMLEVRRRVERQWRAALQFRYAGARRTYALIECSIRPDGSLEYARIVDQGPSFPFAIICVDAMKKAAPFPPFPFDVPQIYREDNLEIVWKFSFL